MRPVSTSLQASCLRLLAGLARATLLRVAKVLRPAQRMFLPLARQRGTLGSALSQLACTHAHETLLWASKGRGHTFNYDLINSLDPAAQMSTVWRIPTVPRREKLHGYH